MNLARLKAHLSGNTHRTLRFLLPDGTQIPAHAHVTEVARIDKRFVDCGGTTREEHLCRLQTWVADDIDHRLDAGKLLRILDKAAPILRDDDLEVDVEHEAGWISQFPILDAETDGAILTFRLGTRHTACLASDRCLPPAPDAQPVSISFRSPLPKA